MARGVQQLQIGHFNGGEQHLAQLLCRFLKLGVNITPKTHDRQVNARHLLEHVLVHRIERLKVVQVDVQCSLAVCDALGDLISATHFPIAKKHLYTKLP